MRKSMFFESRRKVRSWDVKIQSEKNYARGRKN
jgi:hypothetical protein